MSNSTFRLMMILGGLACLASHVDLGPGGWVLFILFVVYEARHQLRERRR